MNLFLVSTLVLTSIIIGLIATWRSTKQQLQEAKKQLEGFKHMSNQAFDPNSLIKLQNRFSELEKKVQENIEKEDKEFNTLWAELENLRSEMLEQINAGITLHSWHSLLTERIPNILDLKTNIKTLMALDKDLAGQFRLSLPAYLINDNMLAGLLDFARLPYERINWMELIILPVNAQLESQEQEALAEEFQKFLLLIGYDWISPTIGELYRPDQHEVVEQRLSSSARGTILLVKSRGYLYQNQILRKSKVVISAGQN
jgi:molecular chaperone GrpE (heat shock protein)